MPHRRALSAIDRFGPRAYFFIILMLVVSSSILFYKAVYLSHQIQRERRDSIRRACLNQNNDHDATIKQLKQITKETIKAAVTPAQKLQIQNSQKLTILLIDALAPKQDCDALAKQSTSP